MLELKRPSERYVPDNRVFGFTGVLQHGRSCSLGLQQMPVSVWILFPAGRDVVVNRRNSRHCQRDDFFHCMFIDAFGSILLDKGTPAIAENTKILGGDHSIGAFTLSA